MAVQESGTRSRTRAAIVDAAIDMLAADGSATLGDIAVHAHVGRSTLHRYFPERSNLLRAVAREVLVQIDQSVARVEAEAAPFHETLQRTIDALLDHGPIVMFTYTDATILADTELWKVWMDADNDVVAQLFARQDAPLRSPITPSWASSVFWSLLHCGWEATKGSTMTRRDVVEAIMTTFTHGLLAPQEIAR